MEQELLEMLVNMMSAFQGGKTMIGIVAAVLVVVFLARKLGSKLPGKVGAFLGSRWGGWLLAALFGVGTSVLAALMSGAPVTPSLIVGALLSLASAGGAELVKDTKSALSPPGIRGVVKVDDV